MNLPILAQTKITYNSSSSMDGLPELFAKLGASGAIFALIATLFIHLALAVAVYKYASQLNSENGASTYFVGEIMWALITLILGPVGLAIYWLINHSTLRPKSGE